MNEIVSLLVFYKDCFGIWLPSKFDIPFNKETKKANQALKKKNNWKYNYFDKKCTNKSNFGTK